ncbi:unnamed protein product, partial [Staurois parvus]
IRSSWTLHSLYPVSPDPAFTISTLPGPPNDPNNLRPISLLPFTSKLLECLVYTGLCSHLMTTTSSTPYSPASVPYTPPKLPYSNSPTIC